MKKVIERFFNQQKFDDDYRAKFNEILRQRYGVTSLEQLARSSMVPMEVMSVTSLAQRVDPVQRIAEKIKSEISLNPADYTTETEYELLNTVVNSSNQVVFVVVKDGKARALTDDGKGELIVVEA